MRHTWRTMWITLLALAVTPAARAEPYTGDGFSFEVPNGWVTVTRDKTGHEHRSAEIRAFIDRIDMSGLAVVAFDSATRSEVVPHIMISEAPGAARLDEAAAEQLAKAAAEKLRQSGMFPTITKTSRVSTAGTDAVRIELTGSPLLGGSRIRQTMVIIPRGEKSWGMACVASETDYPAYEASFEKALASLRIEGPIGPAAGRLPKNLLYGAAAVLGGAVLLYILSKALGKPRRPARS